jgi:hypothetical protein
MEAVMHLGSADFEALEPINERVSDSDWYAGFVIGVLVAIVIAC